MSIKTKMKAILCGGEDINALNRDKWVIEHLQALPAGIKMLDAGAGEMQYKEYCGHLNYVSQDLCEYTGGENVDYGLQTKQWNTSKIDIVSDIIDMPVEDASFDAVLCTEVLEHLPHPEKAIKEFSRIIKKNGVLLLTAPFCSLTHFAPYHYCTGFNIFWYEKHLEENGFKLVEQECNGNYYSYMLQEIKRIIHFKQTKKDIMLQAGGRFLMAALLKYEQADNNMSDLLCFGYHVKAVRI